MNAPGISSCWCKMKSAMDRLRHATMCSVTSGANGLWKPSVSDLCPFLLDASNGVVLEMIGN